jgi:EAL domain-containing protein (putative c-di-GMP-specific phosphodiesterase class I)
VAISEHDLDGGVVVVTAQPVLSPEHLVSAVFAAVATTLGKDAVYDVASGPQGSVLVHIRKDDELPDGLNVELERAVRRELNRSGRTRSMIVVAVLDDVSGPRSVARQLALEWLSKAGPEAFISSQTNAYQQAIRALLDNDRMRIVFQPIVEAWTGRVAGYEALCRGPRGDILEMPDAFFDALERSSLQTEAYMRLMELALLRAAAVLPDRDAILFVNAPPEQYWKVNTDAEDISTWPWTRIVVEITEKAPIRDREKFLSMVEWGRRIGVSFALDDVGAGYAGLSSFALLQPEFTKVDMGIVRGCDGDPTRRAIIASLVALAHRTGSQVIAEGVETAAELEALRWLGVDLVQGYLVGRPSETPEVSRELWLPARRRRRSAYAAPRSGPGSPPAEARSRRAR